ncbi:MAG: phenylacetate--CoA ligase family protein [Kiritimatiellae bacterium]|nr:phenylacetate--CoA ligase family protein [Kiritimatiellia bacterium]
MKPHLSAVLSRWLIDRAGGHRARVICAFREKSAEAFMDAARREELVSDRLRQLLVHARQHVPHFRRLLSDASLVDGASAREALVSLPVMERSDIQSSFEEFLPDTAVEVAEDATGGSTGTPMRFKVDPATHIARASSLWWADNLAGWEPGDRVAMLWGSERDVRSAVRELRLHVRWWIENMRWHNAFLMGEERMAGFHRDLGRFRPHLLVAYAGAAFAFARYLDASGRRPAYPLKAVVSSAEVLTADMRRVVEKVFGRPAFDRYGNREFGAIAAECSAHRGLHVNESDMIVEVGSADPFNVPGPILVTSLTNYAMPFIRYNTGDLGIWEPAGACACGRTSRRLRGVVGRVSDVIRTACGDLIHGEYFTHLLYGTNDVRQFQFIQEESNRYRLLLVADRSRVAAREPEWRDRILERVGKDAELSVEYVDHIPELPSGKHRFTISRVTPSGSLG